MKRTITVTGKDVYYLGKLIDYMAELIIKHFGLHSSRKYKYAITVTESKNGPYHICYSCIPESYYELWKNEEYCGLLCIKHFPKLFPIVKIGRKYNVTVKKVKK